MKLNKINLNNWIAVIFEIFAVIIFATRFIMVVTTFSDYPILEVVASVGLLAFFGAFIVFYHKLAGMTEKIKEIIRKISVTKMIISIIVLSLVTKFALMSLFKIDASHDSDFAAYWSFIQQMTDGSLIVRSADYAMSYKYTVIHATFFLPFTRIFGAKSYFVVITYLILLFTVSAVLLFDLVRYYKGKNYAFMVAMLWILYPLGMLQPLLNNHENDLVVLMIISMWIFFRVMPAAKNVPLKALSFLASVITIVYAALINQFALVAIIAYSIIICIKWLNNKKTLKTFFSVIAMILSFAIIFVIGDFSRTIFVENKVDQSVVVENNTTSNQIPYAWSFYVGRNYETGGGWNKADYDEFYKYRELGTDEEQKQYQIDIVNKRIDEYKAKPYKILVLLYKKMTAVFGQFNPINYDYGNNRSKILTEWHGGIIHKLFTLTMNCINLIFAFIIMMSYNKKSNSNDIDYFENFPKLFIMGVTLIMIVNEANGKYTSFELPLFMTIFIFSLPDFKYNMDKLLLRKINK